MCAWPVDQRMALYICLYAVNFQYLVDCQHFGWHDMLILDIFTIRMHRTRSKLHRRPIFRFFSNFRV